MFKKQSKIVPHICDTDALEKLLKDKLGTEMTMDSIKKPKYVPDDYIARNFPFESFH